MKKVITIILFSFGLCIPAAAFAQSFPSDDIASVKMLLSGYHGLATRASFEKVTNANGIVASLSTRNDLVGDRALAALGRYWPTDTVFAQFQNVLKDRTVRFGRKEVVMSAAATAFGDRALPMLSPLLSDPDVQIRVSAIQSIATIASDSSYDALRNAAEVETNPYVLRAFTKYGRSIH